MPITRVPVVHKFGIISHSQRLELQERLLKQTYLQSVKSKRIHVSQRNPLEVSEEFIQQFNNAETYDEKTRCEEIARKMLERAKRRAGVRNSGTGHHVNLPLAWTELAQIAQCKGTIQEECLDILIASLDVSPLAKYHIPALFFLAETMLYWLRTDAVHQPYLRTGEIKLLRMGQLVFQRLFYHHMTGQLQGHTDFKNRLFTYTDGLAECQEAYNPYPNALLSMRFIIEVSKIILADTAVEPGEVKEGDNMPGAPRHNMDELESVTKEMYEREQLGSHSSSHSGAISSSVHDLSPTLWHALDVWRCTNSLSGGFREALKALAHCGLGLASETWVDGIIALNILAETAKSNMAAMKVLHHLAQGVKATEDLTTPPLSSHSGHSDMFSISSNDDEMILKQSDSHGSYLSSKPSLSDIYERSDEGDPEKKMGSSGAATGISSGSNSNNIHGSQTSAQDTLDSKEDEDDACINQEGDTDPTKPKPVLKESPLGQKNLKSREVSFDETSIAVKDRSNNHTDKSPSRRPNHGGKGTQSADHSQQMPDSHPGSKSSGVPGTGFQPEVGSDFFTSRGSDASSAPTFTNLPLPETPGINGWHWEVAFTYTDMLADICINGSSASIQKMALVGMNMDLSDPHRRLISSTQMPSAGLLDLVAFCALNEASDGGPNDWSWRIRYGAIQALVKVVRSLDGDKVREGLHTAAWNALLKAHSCEKDGRVLEALKVGQVHTDIHGILGNTGHTSAIGSRIAAGLSVIYLPPLPPPVDMTAPRRPHPPRHFTPTQATRRSTQQRQPLRTSLKEELDLAMSLYEPPVDFNTRTSFDLRRIVEDQWRKDLQKQLADEEEKRRKDLELKQKDEETRQRLVSENKARKLQGKAPLQSLPVKSASSVNSKKASRSASSIDSKKPARSMPSTPQVDVKEILGSVPSSPNTESKETVQSAH